MAKPWGHSDKRESIDSRLHVGAESGPVGGVDRGVREQMRGRESRADSYLASLYAGGVLCAAVFAGLSGIFTELERASRKFG